MELLEGLDLNALPRALQNYELSGISLWILQGLALLLGAITGALGGDGLQHWLRLQSTRTRVTPDAYLADWALSADQEEVQMRRINVQQALLADLGLSRFPWLRIWHLLAAAAGTALVITTALGMPPAMVLLISGAVLAMADFVLKQRWAAYVTRIEADLPGVVAQIATRLSSGISLRRALQDLTEREEAAPQTSSGSPSSTLVYFRLIHQVVTQLGLRQALRQAMLVADAITPQLQTALFLLMRADEIGGKEYATALLRAAEQMTANRAAQTASRTAADKAQKELFIVIGIFLAMLTMMGYLNPAMRAELQGSLGTSLSIGVAITMAIGYLIFQAAVRRALSS